MKYWLICFLMVCSSSFSYAQSEGDTWVFSSNIVIRFNEDRIASTDTFANYKGLFFFFTSFTGNDSLGNLQFYTNGAYIYNRLGQIMDGCDTFISPSTYIKGITSNGNGVGAGATQGVVGFKKPGSDHLFYLFHNITSDCALPSDESCYLYYSMIDMSQNAGLGRVVDLNHLVYTVGFPYLSPNALMACKHANGKDWWLVVGKAYNQKENLMFLIDEQGVHQPTTQTIGDTTLYINPNGRIIFSPDGTIMAKGYGVGRTNLFDFNRCDGTLSNPRYINTLDSLPGNPSYLQYSTSIAFSPNGRFLYVNSYYNIFQYDFWANDIQSSEVLVAHINTDTSDYNMLSTQLAPDGRIYIGCSSCPSYDKFLSVINKPNEKGVACDFRYAGVPFPFMQWHGVGIPNMPNYHLPPSPIYQAQAGENRSVCKDSTTQLGNAIKVNELVYTWSSNDQAAYISNVNAHNPLVTTNKDEAEFYLTVTDTVSTLTCTEKTDTVKVITYTCTNPTYPIHLPTFVNAATTPYYIIANLPANTALRVFNAAGQLIYKTTTYQNDWNVALAASGVYVVEAVMSDNTKYRGKVVVVN